MLRTLSKSPDMINRDASDKRAVKAIKEGSTWLQESKITVWQWRYISTNKEIISRGQNLIIATKA